ncbi:mitochondrial proton/calcium exchanger protein-like protein isoform X1 [Tanacetum coccineum]
MSLFHVVSTLSPPIFRLFASTNDDNALTEKSPSSSSFHFHVSLRVKKLEKKNKSRTYNLKRLYKVGLSARVESSGDKESLEMFDVDTLTGDEVFGREQASEKGDVIKDPSIPVSTVTASTKDIAATTTTATIPTPRKGIVFQEPGTTTTTTISSQQPSQENVQDKGKGKMNFDEEVRLAREKAEKEQEANVALTEEWDDIQAKIEADHELAQRLQAQEQEELSDAEKATLFVQLLEKRRKYFIAKRAKEKRNKPPTYAQQRKIMCTYLKNIEGKKPKDLKNKSFDSIQKMFDRAFKRVNTFVDFRTDLVEGRRVALDAIPLAVKSPSIVGLKIHKEGKKSYYQIIRADGKDNVWKNQSDYRVLDWKLYDSCGVHSLRKQNGRIVGIKRLLDDLRVTTAQVCVTAAERKKNPTDCLSLGRSTETSDGLAAIQAQLNNLGREIKKVNEKVYAAQVGCEQCKGPHYTKDCPLKEEGKTLEKAYYRQIGGPFQGGGYRATTPRHYQRNNTNPSYQERRQSMEDTLSKFMSELAKRHKENSNLIKEIRATTNAAIRNQGASIKTLEIQIGQMSKVLQERGFGNLPSSTETNPRDQVKSISTIIEVDSYSIRRIGSFQYAVSTGQNNILLYKSRQTTVPFPSHLDNHYCEEEVGIYGPKFTEAYGASHINNTIPRKEKDLGSFTLPCYINNVCFDNALVDLGASISVMSLLTYLNLGLGELAHTRLIVELADRTVKYTKGIAENVLVEIGKFTFPVDIIIFDMPEGIKVPLILGRPFLSTARAKIDVYKRKITLRVGEERIVFSSVKPASSLIKRVYMLSFRERMELDLEARLMGETFVLNISLDPFLKDYIELNDLNEPFELRRNQGDDLMPTIEEGEVIEEFRTRDDELDTEIDDYPILEDMDAYRDKGMGDVIFGEPFLRKVGIKTKQFEGIITLYKSDDEVTYQMVRSHPRFKHHTNEQCNKIPPLLKVSERDKKNGISHAYQKLKGFYKGVLNLGPDYIRNAKTEEWITREHISVHEME